jgi:hypothetical protein
MRAGVKGFLVRNEDGFVGWADIKDFGWAKLCAEGVDSAAGFAEDAVCRDWKDVQRIMGNRLKSHPVVDGR